MLFTRWHSNMLAWHVWARILSVSLDVKVHYSTMNTSCSWHSGLEGLHSQGYDFRSCRINGTWVLSQVALLNIIFSCLAWASGESVGLVNLLIRPGTVDWGQLTHLSTSAAREEHLSLLFLFPCSTVSQIYLPKQVYSWDYWKSRCHSEKQGEGISCIFYAQVNDSYSEIMTGL